MSVTRNLGMLTLGAWLVLSGVIPLIGLSFQGIHVVMAVLAIVSGALIIAGR